MSDGGAQGAGAERTAPMQRARRESPAARYQRIYRAIRERISLLHYPPGTLLSESELAAEFRVSRTPVRRVLQRLEFEGLVTIKNGVGTIVTDIDLKTFKAIYDLRMRLAELIGELSPRQPGPATLRRVEALHRRARALVGHRDIEEYARICNELEECVLEVIGSAPLREITDILYYRAARTWLTFLPDLDWAEVSEALEAETLGIFKALQRNDIRGVGQLRRLHFHRLLAQLGSFIAKR